MRWLLPWAVSLGAVACGGPSAIDPMIPKPIEEEEQTQDPVAKTPEERRDETAPDEAAPDEAAPDEAAPEQQVIVSEPKAGGSRSSQDVRTVIAKARNKFRGCYESGLARDPSLKGKVVVTFTIEKGGSVRKADSAGTLPDEITKCVTDEIRQLQFPAASDETQVNYPFVFAASN